jgi:hypothetical protein
MVDIVVAFNETFGRAAKDLVIWTLLWTDREARAG